MEKSQNFAQNEEKLSQQNDVNVLPTEKTSDARQDKSQDVENITLEEKTANPVQTENKAEAQPSEQKEHKIPKKKKEKIKKPKKPINKKMLSLSLVCAGFLCFVVAIICVFNINYSLGQPSSVTIYDTGSSVYVSTDATTGYYGYRFKFESAQGNVTLDSEQPFCTLDEASLIAGTRYSVSVCFLGAVEGANSVYGSSISWTAYTYLSAPKITLSSDLSTLSWEAVTGATYYKVYYLSTSLSYITTTEESISLSLLPSGDLDIFVVASSSSSYYKDSEASNVVETSVVHELSAFTNVSFSQSNCILIATGTEKISKIKVIVGEDEYLAEGFTYSLVDGVYTYRIDISAVYVSNKVIGAKPVACDGQVYNGGYVYA